MTATNMCLNFGGFRCSHALTELSRSNLMKIVTESPEKLTDGNLEEIVDVWNRKGRQIAV